MIGHVGHVHVLPTIVVGDKTYTVDRSLNQFRVVDQPYLFIDVPSGWQHKLAIYVAAKIARLQGTHGWPIDNEMIPGRWSKDDAERIIREFEIAVFEI